MSELAHNEYGDEWTAYDLKDAFLHDGTKFENFFCAFCSVPVTLAAAYGSEYKKAPHFRLADNLSPHHHECPYGGKASPSHRIRRSPLVKHEFDVDLPECLVPMSPRRINTLAGRDKLSKPASTEEVKKRAHATKSIANRYTTALLQILAKARLEAINAILALPRVRALESKDQWREVFAILKKCPLNLHGRTSNYSSAFHKTTHAPWTGSYIYYGHNATVNFIEAGFRISSSDRIPSNAGEERLANIIVNCDISSPRNQMEAKTIEVLTEAQRSNTLITWYAYGELAFNNINSAYQLIISEPSYIYTQLKKRGSF